MRRNADNNVPLAFDVIQSGYRICVRIIICISEHTNSLETTKSIVYSIVLLRKDYLTRLSTSSITIHRKTGYPCYDNGPSSIPPHYNRKDGIMNATTPPLFSDFLLMKKQNPSRYWLPVTAAQMTKAYIHHGPAYFDLHNDQSL